MRIGGGPRFRNNFEGKELSRFKNRRIGRRWIPDNRAIFKDRTDNGKVKGE